MKVVVVGGVAGGASAAARLRRLDEAAEIVLLERGAYVSYANCGLPYHIGGVIEERGKLLVQTPESLAAALALDVRTGHETLSIDRAAKNLRVRERASGREYDEPYDKLILAQGGVPVRPAIPGIDHPRLFTLRDVPDMDAIIAALDGARRAVVIGAGYVGIEVAENLHHRGLQVDVVELMDQIVPTLDPEMARSLEDHLRARGVALHLGAGARRFEDRGGRIGVRLDESRLLEADLAVIGVGVRPQTSLARAAGLELGESGGVRTNAHMQTSDPDVYAVGDMVEVRDTVLGRPSLIALAGPANRQGRVAADHIGGVDSRYTTTQGTSIVQVFDLVAAGTGLTERQLRAADVDYRKVHLHPAGHATYYPGTASMHMKLLFAPEGRLLGAQVVGRDGVDKRVDVLATALRAGMTVYDLEQLELAYAPPFGSAKDPVNMAGFLAANLLRGDVRFWYAEDYPDATRDALLLDVRRRDEFDEWHVPGSVHIPHTELRERLDELPRDRRILCYCRSGQRSYLAYRLLAQSGFGQAATLAGGTLTFANVHREFASGA